METTERFICPFVLQCPVYRKYQELAIYAPSGINIIEHGKIDIIAKEEVGYTCIALTKLRDVQLNGSNNCLTKLIADVANSPRCAEIEILNMLRDIEHKTGK